MVMETKNMIACHNSGRNSKKISKENFEVCFCTNLINVEKDSKKIF